ncbi:MAG: hypothetical protein DRQ40_09440 [Gammaproteobacteria bacterium]|nr:MAG: hypothetical protein DRQ40_09440 [Gammaproteobacteria bacterium]
MSDRWQDSLPEDMRTNPTLDKFKDPEGLAKSYIELERMQSRSLTIPGEHSTDDDWDKYYTKAQEGGHLTVHPDHASDEHKKAFWKSLGVPESTDGYSMVDDFEGLPDDTVSGVRELAVKAGWTNKQFQKTLAALREDHVAQSDVNSQALAEDKGIVDKMFGLAKEQKMSAIGALAEQFIDPKVPPAWAGDLSKLSAGDLIFMDNLVKGFTGKGPQAFKQPDTNGQQYTPGELDEMIDKLTTDMETNGRQMGKDRYNALLAKRIRYIGMRGASN